MSGNAALAAAKRRRNAPSGMVNESSSNNFLDQSRSDEQSGESRKTYNLQSLVKEHDYKIFKLERSLSSESGSGNEQLTGSVNNAENLAKANAVEIRLLKLTVQKQTKMQQETNSLLTTLRATLNAQTAEFNTLRTQSNELYALKNLENNTTTEPTQNIKSNDSSLVDDLDTMKLNVIEKDDQ
jgi:hypothetical protein